MQLFTIVVSHGDLLVLGEAYAFGVVWSFVFKALAMVVLRFRDRKPREFMVPLNIKIGTLEFPIGLILIFLVLLASAIANLFTKDVATVWGLGFTIGFLAVFICSETYYERGRKGAKHEHHEQFNRADTNDLSLEGLGGHRPSVSQTRGHPLSAEFVHARKGAGGIRSGDHVGRRHDGQKQSGALLSVSRSPIKTSTPTIND